jgi:hypothetical protein
MDLAFPEARTQIVAIIVFAFGILFSSQSIVRTLIREKPGKGRVTGLLIDGFQIVLTTVLCYFIYQGQAWANLTLGVLSAIAGLVIIPFAAIALRSAFIGPAWLLIQATVYLVASWFLLRLP